ncbi:MAG: dihydroorotate dehydrogenase electron transfer subunit [Woeseia sp.]|nr:dihydroorotate dehydrogenase electron transfer subunit [Woeseia sp.]NNL53842.1 dihydroorotate dehydrogenase electron transfer subunit [Woeseia sp.]
MTRAHRDTIFVEDAAVLAVEHFPGAQFVLRLQAPECAARATAGSFAHVRCDESLPMRRPLSIMRANAAAGWIEVLFKIVGHGLDALARRAPGDKVSVLGPIGRGFRPDPARVRPLLIGGGVGIPPMVFLAETLRDAELDWQPLVLMGSELPFPFPAQRSKLAADWLEGEINSAHPLIESWGMPSRLASLNDFDGCFQGFVTELADKWLASLTTAELATVEVFACGPTPMLEATAALAARYELPCQVSLEEFMACAVGGCAGCTVLVQEDDGPAMKRVCVDGPVFDAARVFHADA